jgi:dolichol-phosphate mannosyltransferase
MRSNYREKNRFLRGYVQSVGYKKTSITYEAHERAGGHSKYTFRKLLHFSVNTIVGFSDFPLKIGIYAGIFAALLGTIALIYTLCTFRTAPSGYATIVILICFLFAMLFIVVGIIGEYISILFREMKDRPIYLVEKTKNLD